MTITEANDINKVLRWAMGQGDHMGTPYPDEQVTEAGRRLAAKAYKVLSAGLRPEDVVLKREVFDEDLSGEPECRVCGCTTERPCQGGCRRVDDPKMIGELCDQCAVLLEQVHLL